VAARFISAIPFGRLLHYIIRKYNELKHRDRAQININSDKNIIHGVKKKETFRNQAYC
jgi:hypothetical protein